MAKLPDAQALGERQTPSPRGGIPSGPSNAGLPEAVQARDATKGVVEFANTLQKAGMQIRQREESVARLKDLDLFETTANEEMRRVAAEGDLSRLETVKGFGGFLRQLEATTLNNHSGGEDSKIRLSGRFQEIRTNLSSQMAARSNDAVRKKTEEIYGGYRNQLSLDVYDDPSQFDSAVARYNARIDEGPGSLDEKATYKLAALGDIAESAISKFIDSGAISDIPGSMNDVMDVLDSADVRRSLGEARRNRILNSVAAAQRPQKPSEFAEKMGAAGFDLNKPTAESRQFARDVMLKPQVSISNQAEAAGRAEKGKLDAKRVDELTTNAVNSYQRLSEIDRYRTALDTGGFKVGSLGDYRATLARFADLLGAPDDIKNLIGSAKTADILDSAAQKMAMTEIPKFGQRTLAAEIKILERAMPTIWRTEEGNRILLDVLEKAADRDIKMAEIAQDIFEEKGSLQAKDRNFLQELRKLEKTDPLITNEIKSRITSEVQKAPATLGEAIRKNTEDVVKGLRVPPGWDFVRLDENGKVVLKNKTSGKEMVGSAESLK